MPAASAAPADAVPDVRTRVHYVTGARGGRGAVRELAERLLGARGVWTRSSSVLSRPRIRPTPARPAIPERRQRSAGKALRSALLTGLGRSLDLLFSALGWRRAQRLGRAFGRLAWRLARRDRGRTLDHLALAYPELTVVERSALGRRCFEHLGTLLGECLHLRHAAAAELSRHVTLEGWEHVEAARALARPILIVTGHCGNWELLAATLNARGLGMLVVAREIDEPGLQTMLLDLRARFGTRTIVRGTPGAARALLGALRGAGALGMLIDQDTKVEELRRLLRPPGLDAGRRRRARVALRRRGPPDLHRALRRRQPSGGDPPVLALPVDPTAATALMTAAIEAQIRSHPSSGSGFTGAGEGSRRRDRDPRRGRQPAQGLRPGRPTSAAFAG